MPVSVKNRRKIAVIYFGFPEIQITRLNVSRLKGSQNPQFMTHVHDYELKLVNTGYPDADCKK